MTFKTILSLLVRIVLLLVFSTLLGVLAGLSLKLILLGITVVIAIILFVCLSGLAAICVGLVTSLSRSLSDTSRGGLTAIMILGGSAFLSGTLFGFSIGLL